MANIICYCDGGYYRDKGTGYGSFKIYDTTGDVTIHTRYDHVTSSVDAEYQTFISLLAFLKEHYPSDISLIVYSDSKVMVNHINSLWLVSAINLIPLFQTAISLFTTFENRAIIWVGRKLIVKELGH